MPLLFEKLRTRASSAVWRGLSHKWVANHVLKSKNFQLCKIFNFWPSPNKKVQIHQEAFHFTICEKMSKNLFNTFLALILLAITVHNGLGQSWTDDNCQVQCFATNNCASGCGIQEVCPAGWNGRLARLCYRVCFHKNTMKNLTLKIVGYCADNTRLHCATGQSPMPSFGRCRIGISAQSAGESNANL